MPTDTVVVTVFVVGPYFGSGDFNEIDDNIRRAECAAIALANKGLFPVTPHLNSRHFQAKAEAPGSETFWRSGYRQLIRSNAIQALLVLPGWEKSSGSRAEIETAARIKKRVFFTDDPAVVPEDLLRWAKALRVNWRQMR